MSNINFRYTYKSSIILPHKLHERLLSSTISLFVHQASWLFSRMTNYVTYPSHYSNALLSQVQSFGAWEIFVSVVCSTSACEKPPFFSTGYRRLLNDLIWREQPPGNSGGTIIFRKNVRKIATLMLKVRSRSIIVPPCFLKNCDLDLSGSRHLRLSVSYSPLSCSNISLVSQVANLWDSLMF